MSRLVFIAGFAAGWLAARRRPRPRGGGVAPAPSEFTFLSLMSHELKTPVNIIAGYLELLEHGIPDPLPESAREHVRQAHQAAVRMAHLVSDLMTWTRLERDGGRPHIERVAAADIVGDACEALFDQAAARGIRLEVSVPPDLQLTTDHSSACQALRALVSNGLKFTDSGGVEVTVERSGRRVLFRVRDTGSGISREHLETIFAPYWQLEATVRRTRGGVGIGLALARRLARMLGGDITVRSTPGDGSEFVMDLPGE